MPAALIISPSRTSPFMASRVSRFGSRPIWPKEALWKKARATLGKARAQRRHFAMAQAPGKDGGAGASG
jgi:hypothetical protein